MIRLLRSSENLVYFSWRVVFVEHLYSHYVRAHNVRLSIQREAVPT